VSLPHLRYHDRTTNLQPLHRITTGVTRPIAPGSRTAVARIKQEPKTQQKNDKTPKKTNVAAIKPVTADNGLFTEKRLQPRTGTRQVFAEKLSKLRSE